MFLWLAAGTSGHAFTFATCDRQFENRASYFESTRKSCSDRKVDTLFVVAVIAANDEHRQWLFDPPTTPWISRELFAGKKKPPSRMSTIGPCSNHCSRRAEWRNRKQTSRGKMMVNERWAAGFACSAMRRVASERLLAAGTALRSFRPTSTSLSLLEFSMETNQTRHRPRAMLAARISDRCRSNSCPP